MFLNLFLKVAATKAIGSGPSYQTALYYMAEAKCSFSGTASVSNPVVWLDALSHW